MLYLVKTDWYIWHFEARVIFHRPSAKCHDICQLSAHTNVVMVNFSVSTMKCPQKNAVVPVQYQEPQRVAGKLYNSFRGKQNKT